MNEIKIFLEYGTVEEHRAAAIQLLERFAHDGPALSVLSKYYRELPEADCDGVRELRLVAANGGILFMAALTFLGRTYLYLVQDDDGAPDFLGAVDQLDITPEHIAFLGLGKTAEEIRARILTAPPYIPVAQSGKLCPVCYCAEGATHVPGCPVEVCPWCGGQLTRCGCRFDRLGTEEIASEAACARFLDMLERAGRVRYRRDQRPAYPSDN